MNNNKSKRLNNLKKIFPILSQNKGKKKHSDVDEQSGSVAKENDSQEINDHKPYTETHFDVEHSPNYKKVQNVKLTNIADVNKSNVNNEIYNDSTTSPLKSSPDKKLAEKSTSSSSSTLVSDTEHERTIKNTKTIEASVRVIRKGSFTDDIRKNPHNKDKVTTPETIYKSGRTSAPITGYSRDFTIKQYSSPPMNAKKKMIIPKPTRPNAIPRGIANNQSKFNAFSDNTKTIPNIVNKNKINKLHIEEVSSVNSSEQVSPNSTVSHNSSDKTNSPIYDDVIENLEKHQIENKKPIVNPISVIVKEKQLDEKYNKTIKPTVQPLTLQKIKNLQNVEAYCWNQLKKMKQKQDFELYKQTVSANDMMNSANTITAQDYGQVNSNARLRCRSVSPSFIRTNINRNLVLHPTYQQIGKNNNNPYELYSNPINNDTLLYATVNKNVNNPNFTRGSRQRNTIGSTDTYNRNQRYVKVADRLVVIEKPFLKYDKNKINSDINRNVKYEMPLYQVPSQVKQEKNDNYENRKQMPIFRRGSLSLEANTSTPYKEKRVSFSKIENERPPSVRPYKEPTVPDNMEMFYSSSLLQDPVIEKKPINNYTIVATPDHVYGEIRKVTATSIPVQKKPVKYEQAKYGVPARIPNVVKNTRAPLALPIHGRMNNMAKAQGVRQYVQDNLHSPFHRYNPSSSSRSGLGSESESGSEAGEVRRILFGEPQQGEEDWNPDAKGRGDGSASEGGRSRSARRDDPRRHTLGGDLLRPVPQHMDQELPRGYPPPSSAMLFDDDPGIMSEVETASTGFRRGGKQRSSLPVVRTPSKTLERPLGLVFLQYRSETKRALLPNEITSIDTVKALFVRSFPKQLTMEYLDSPLVKIYIHDSSKDMFYELEDLRSHLRDIRDRSVLRLFESADVSGGTFPGSLGGAVGMPPSGHPGSGPPSWDQDQSYFSEPEFDSEYHHQHIHKSKVINAVDSIAEVNAKPPAYYMGAGPPSTLPRGGSLMRAYSPAGGAPIPADRIKSLPAGSGAPPKPLRAYGSTTSVIRGGSERCFPFSQPVDAIRAPDQLYSLPADRIHNDGYMSSPERSSRGAYEEPYYTQYVGPPRGGMTPVIDEETGDPSLLDDQYSLYSVKIPSGPRPAVRVPPYEGNRLNAHSEDLQQRMRVEHMERQLANLTGLVQKALQAPGTAQSPREFLSVGPHFRNNSQESADPFLRTERPPKLGKGRYHKSVSFEKSVSFSDEPPDMNSPKQHSPQHNDTKPPKPAIKSSTLPRMSSQERERLKPVPPPKPKALQSGMVIAGGSQMVMMPPIDYYAQLKMLRKRCDDFRLDMRNLRRLSLSHSHTMREMICDTFAKFRTATAGGGDFNFHEDSLCLARDEEIYKQEMLKLEVDLSDLETTVEQLRGNVINRKTRVNMLDVEKMALVLSKSSKTVADLKVRFPSLHDGIKNMLGNEMEKVVRQEKFLKEEPERLEIALRRCKKLTGTLVTLKRLASVQEQRLPCEGGRMSPGGSSLPNDDQNPHETGASGHGKGAMGSESGGAGGMAPLSLGGNLTPDNSQRSENALDALLDELQTFARPPSPGGDEEESGLIRRLRSCSSTNGDNELSPPVAPRGQSATKPPVPERNPDLLQMAAGRRAPPPPPPRTSSRSPLASPAAPLVPLLSPSNSSSCDSVDSQEPVSKNRPAARHDLLEQRHQELLKKQKALQEQYARLQQIQRGGSSLTVVPPPDLKKTGSESNLLTKMGLNMMPATTISGSLTHLAGTFPRTQNQNSDSTHENPAPALSTKVYETDIL